MKSFIAHKTLTPKGSFYTLLTKAAVISLLGSTSVAVHSQGFGSVTPGGVQPQIERRNLPSADDQPDLDIPAVPERPLDADSGPVIIVKRFQLEGVDAIPSTDIDQKDIHQLLEKIRSSQPEGFTVGQLQEVANQVTQYYRQQGLILALAIIPQQDINEGTVVISVLPGELGQLSTANNQRYSDKLLQSPFQALVGKPVQVSDIESALLRLDDLPGLDAFGVFRPGENIGETELVLNAKTETPFEFGIYADDHGVESTGKQRLIGNVVWNNPLGTGDQLSITALQTFDPEDSLYGAIRYESLIFSPALSAGFSYSSNDYAISQNIASAIPDTDGETQITSIFTRYSFIRSRNFSLWGTLDFSQKHAEVAFSDFDVDLGEDDLSVFSADMEINSVDSILGGGINEISASYHHGLADFAGSMDSNGDNNPLRDGAGGDFQKVAVDLTRLQLVSENNKLLLRFQGQYSDDLLSSIEQFSMGGPNSVRAYPVSEYIRDKAMFASAEWLMDLPGLLDISSSDTSYWERAQLSFFLDYAKGIRNDPRPSEKKEQNISGAGIGLSVNFRQDFFIKMEAATPISNQDASNGNNPQLWLSTGLEF